MSQILGDWLGLGVQALVTEKHALLCCKLAQEDLNLTLALSGLRS